jgi:hypothetical protein
VTAIVIILMGSNVEFATTSEGTIVTNLQALIQLCIISILLLLSPVIATSLLFGTGLHQVGNKIAMMGATGNLVSLQRFLVQRGQRFAQSKLHAMSKIGGFGISMGAASIAFSESELIKSQVLLSYRVVFQPRTIYDFYAPQINLNIDELKQNNYTVLSSKSGRPDFELGLEWIDEMRLDPKKWSDRFYEANRETLLIQGHADGFYDTELFNYFIERSDAKVLDIPEADHQFSDFPHRIKVLKSSLNFFNKIL